MRWFYLYYQNKEAVLKNSSNENQQCRYYSYVFIATEVIMQRIYVP